MADLVGRGLAAAHLADAKVVREGRGGLEHGRRHGHRRGGAEAGARGRLVLPGREARQRRHALGVGRAVHLAVHVAVAARAVQATQLLLSTALELAHGLLADHAVAVDGRIDRPAWADAPGAVAVLHVVRHPEGLGHRGGVVVVVRGAAGRCQLAHPAALHRECVLERALVVAVATRAPHTRELLHRITAGLAHRTQAHVAHSA
mmetsp:Transcript_22407/g.57602  ORF Transcript_22407/g.57602 Transcript_22407/m.57602 type:complete len:204 (+) Transcript_22407:698-1309(+)